MSDVVPGVAAIEPGCMMQHPRSGGWGIITEPAIDGRRGPHDAYGGNYNGGAVLLPAPSRLGSPESVEAAFDAHCDGHAQDGPGRFWQLEVGHLW